SILEPLVGRGGWMTCTRLTTDTLETEDVLLLAGFSDDGAPLDDAQCRRRFDLPASHDGGLGISGHIETALHAAITPRRQETLEAVASRNGGWFEAEMEKLDGWAEDRRASFKSELNELETQLKEAKRAARLAGTLPEKLERQRAIRPLESRRHEADRNFEQA